jgi:hypothetical protein
MPVIKPGKVRECRAVYELACGGIGLVPAVEVPA